MHIDMQETHTNLLVAMAASTQAAACMQQTKLVSWLAESLPAML